MMKLRSLEMSGFRGFREEVRFDFADGFNVVVGRNGVGKSAVCDGIEFALTGTLSKYGPDTASRVQEYIWWRGSNPPEDGKVTLTVVNDDGQEVVFTRSRLGGASFSDEEVCQLLCGGPDSPADPLGELARTSIIRDEHIAQWSLDLTKQKRFQFVRDAIGVSERPQLTALGTQIHDRAKALLAEAQLADETARRELNSTLASASAAQAALAREENIRGHAPMLAKHGIELTEDPRAVVRVAEATAADHRARSEQLRRIYTDAKAASELLNSVRSDEFVLQLKAAEEAVSAEETARDAAFEAFEAASEELGRAQQISESATDLAQLVAHGEHLGLQGDQCPLCHSTVSETQFAAALVATKRQIDLTAQAVSIAAEGHLAARNKLHSSEAALGISRDRAQSLRQRIELAEDEISSLNREVASFGYALDVTELEQLGALVFRVREETLELEQFLTRFRSSASFEQLSLVEGRLDRARKDVERTDGDRQRFEKIVQASTQMRRASESASNEIVQERLSSIAPVLAEIYERLRPHIDWRDISYDVAGDVRRALSLSVGDGLDPQFIFSSGQRRAAGLAFLIAIHLGRPWCLLNTLVLDDPVQHIDDFRALNLVEVLAAVQSSGRQVIVTVEDKDLAELLARRVRGNGSSPGRQFELDLAEEGGGRLVSAADVRPLPQRTLRAVS